MTEVSEPSPERRQILARPLFCGICGSDVHARTAGSAMLDLANDVDSRAPHSPMRGPVIDPAQPIGLGHEFCAEIVGLGADVAGFDLGATVVSVPRIVDASGSRHTIGFSPAVPGGFGELMLIDAEQALVVPRGVEPTAAAFSEPLAVALHAIRATSRSAGQPIIIMGCGPIGLAILLLLIGERLGPIILSDPVPARREFAEALGADVVVDPLVQSPGAVAVALSPIPPVIFEAVGVPGMIDQALMDAPANSCIVVVGACLEPDFIRPMLGLGRELSLAFVLGYSDAEFRSSLNMICSGAVDPTPLITEVVSLSESVHTFERLSQAKDCMKILVGTS